MDTIIMAIYLGDNSTVLKTRRRLGCRFQRTEKCHLNMLICTSWTPCKYILSTRTSIVYCKTAVSPLLSHLRYCRPARNYMHVSIPNRLIRQIFCHSLGCCIVKWSMRNTSMFWFVHAHGIQNCKPHWWHIDMETLSANYCHFVTRMKQSLMESLTTDRWCGAVLFPIVFVLKTQWSCRWVETPWRSNDVTLMTFATLYCLFISFHYAVHRGRLTQILVIKLGLH